MLQRRGTATQWATANTILGVGEMGFAYDTNVVKIGNGVTPWNSLDSIDGKSAYEVAVANGFVGTQSAWLLSLVGAPGDISSKLNLSGGTMTGKITLDGDPTQALHAATKQYVDSVEAGLITRPAVRAATTTNLSGTYSNGTAGVNAQLNLGQLATLNIDGVTSWSQYNGILVKNQTNAAENGRYVVLQIGNDVDTDWILKRCPLCDEADEIPGSYIFVTDGTLNEQTGWVQHVDDPSTFTVGTDDIDVFQFSGAGTTTAGTNISVSGNQVSVVDSPTFAGTIIGAPAEPNTDSNTAKNLGYVGLPQVILNSGNLTLSKTHAGKHIYVTGASQTITIPANSSTPFEIGTTVVVINTNLTSSIAITTDTLRLAGTATTGTRTLAAYGMATLVKVEATTWIASGNGLT